MSIWSLSMIKKSHPFALKLLRRKPFHSQSLSWLNSITRKERNPYVLNLQSHGTDIEVHLIIIVLWNEQKTNDIGEAGWANNKKDEIYSKIHQMSIADHLISIRYASAETWIRNQYRLSKQIRK